MATTIQTIHTPKKARALDTSSGWQAISQELFITADAASIANEANGVGAWTGYSGVTPVVVSSGQYAGTYAAKYTASGHGDGMYMDLNTYCTIGKTYEINVWGKHGADGSTDNKHYLRLSPNVSLTDSVNLTNPDRTDGHDGAFQEGEAADEAWSERFIRFTHSTGTRYFGVRESGAANDGSLLVDALSIKEVEFFNNNNHGQIYSGRGLEFDGVTDSLTVPQELFNGKNYTNGTVAAWVNFNSYTTHERIFSHYTDGSTRIYLTINSSNKCIRIQIGDSSAIDGTTGSIQLNTWYRVVMAWNSSGNVNIYVNGHLDKTDTFGLGNLSSLSSAALNWGSHNAGSSYLDGMLSDGQIWDTAWTQSDVTYDYLNPESLALNRGGTSLTNSNLKLWYPMQDGHRGQQSYILDGANTGIGSELVTGGDFSDESDWNHSRGNWDISGGVLSTTSEGDYMYQSIGEKKNITMIITFSISSYTAGSVKFRIFGVTSTTFGTARSSVGTFTEYITFPSDHNGSVGFNGVSFTGSIDNVSVKAINDKNHATTVFYGDNLLAGVSGAADGDWEDSGNTPTFTAVYYGGSGSGITYDPDNTSSPLTGSKDAKITNGAGEQAGIISNAITLVTGRTYRLKYNYLTNYNVSTQTEKLYVKIGETSSTSSSNIDGGGGYAQATLDATSKTAVTLEFTHTDSDTEVFLVLFGGDGLVFQIDDLSFAEVGLASGWTDADQQLHIPQTALQSYNQLAWFRKIEAGATGDTLTVTEFDFTTGQTINLWGYAAELLDYMSFFGSGGSLDYMRLKNGSETEKMEFEGHDNPSPIEIDCGDAGVIQAGKWVMYTFIWNTDRTMDVYFNGELKGSSAAAVDTTDGKKMEITMFGRGYSTGPSFFGAMTEISHYSDVLTQAEINDLFNDGKAKSALEADGSGGLSAYWRNNGLSTWTDLKGSNDGTVTCDETILLPAGVDATRDNQGFLMNKQKDTSILNLDGIGYVEINDSDTLDFGAGNFTIECWARFNFFNVDSVINVIASLGGLHGDNTSSALKTDVDEFIFGIGPSDQVKSSSVLVVGDWYHVVGTRSDSTTPPTMTLYINSTSEGGTDTSSQTVTNALTKWIGADSSDDRPYRHQIDGVKIYSKALSVDEVKRNYNAGKGSHRN